MKNILDPRVDLEKGVENDKKKYLNLFSKKGNYSYCR
jgi:hypothetical protein